ncbi:MAG: putative ATP-grasp-modified RiPP [Pseudonocardiales bacterium]
MPVTVILDPDPLVSSVLPADLGRFRISSDTASARGVRPFGLTRTTVVPSERADIISSLRYDSVRQVTVDDHGAPIVHSAKGRPTTNSDSTTKEDNQEWTDTDPDD